MKPIICISLFVWTLGILPAGAVDVRDQEVFSPELFPELEELSETEIVLRGLHALFPERVFPGDPEQENSTDPKEPLVRSISDEVVYLRAYHLKEAVSVIRENLERPVMILDLRYIHSDLESTVKLAGILSRRPRLHFYAAGDYPLPDSADNRQIQIEGERLRDRDHTLITLSNWETSGPVEVLLEQLRRDADIISIGTQSAGRTASFRPIPDFPDWQILSGELRPDPEVSLVDNGFVPRVNVEVEPEYDRVAYRRLTEENEINDVIQTELTRDREARQRQGQLPSPVLNNDETESGQPPPPDLVLQRAVNIVKALQALGQIPG